MYLLFLWLNVQVFPMLGFTCEGLYFESLCGNRELLFQRKAVGARKSKRERPWRNVIVLQFGFQYIPVFHRSLSDVGTPA